MQPTKEQLKVIAQATNAYIDPNQINLYTLLQSKFPGKDIENDAQAREKYLYYLKVCGGYYAEKNAAKIDRLAEKNARQQQKVLDQVWRALRVRQMVNNDNGTDNDSGSSDAASLSADDDDVGGEGVGGGGGGSSDNNENDSLQENALVIDDTPLTDSIDLPDSLEYEPSMLSMGLPDTESILGTLPNTDSATLSENDELAEDRTDSLTNERAEELMVVSEDLFGGEPVESQSQIQPYVEMVPNATSTQSK